MKTIREETFGKVTLRLLEMKDGYAALAFSADKQTPPIQGKDPEELWAQLLKDAGKARAGYVGIDGAIARFLKSFKGGFSDPAFLTRERNYKVEAKAFLDAALPLSRAQQATSDDAASAMKAFGKTNLLSTFEHARVREVLKSPHGPSFVMASADLAMGNLNALGDLQKLISKFGPASWPIATYLPFFWRPDAAMFLKPQVTVDFAERIGHPFASRYTAELKPTVYESLLSLAGETETAAASLKPADRIDVQSFIWVVGAYDDAEAG